MERKSGILMPISSLPSDYGIGTFGKEARKFVDFLKKAKQTYWQILPLSPTSYGDSPYQSFSTFAGNPYFIDFDILKDWGLLKKSDYSKIDWGSDNTKVDYGKIYNKRFIVLKKAVGAFLNQNNFDEYNNFLNSNISWINDYALFMCVKGINHNKGLIDWDEKYRLKDKETIDSVIDKYEDEIEFWKIIQFFFYKQWFELKEYANSNGVEIIGDCPIYVASDSADLWNNPEIFEVDENLVPINVAGVPPDDFTADGQLWGNPLYRWDVLKDTGYKWWAERVSHLCYVYDYLRIDHFRGLSQYFSVKYGEKTARNGKWLKGPGNDIVDIFKQYTDNKIIAEDLGYLDDEVKELLAYSGYPGMAVLEFGFGLNDDNTNFNTPYNLKKNQVVYISTQDSDTLVGWLKAIPKKQLNYVKRFINYNKDEELHWQMIGLLLSSVSDTAIILAQDLLALDNDSRTNRPGILGGNWMWRAKKGDFNLKIANKLKKITQLYGRE